MHYRTMEKGHLNQVDWDSEDFQHASFKLSFSMRSSLDKGVQSHLDSMCREMQKRKNGMWMG